jgi:hypothetical protein
MMMSDIVERLRWEWEEVSAEETADEIERLRAALERFYCERCGCDECLRREALRNDDE